MLTESKFSNMFKLNVGSRDEIKPDPWLNIDIEPLKPRDNYIQMDVFDMPADWTDRFDEIHAIHVLEHINRNKRQDFVNALFRVTEPGGVCFIEVPNFREIVQLLNLAYLREDKEKQHIWTTSIYGKQRSPGDQHCWGFTVDTLRDLMKHAGFSQVIMDSTCLEAYGYRALQPISAHYKQEPVILAKGVK